MKTKIKLVNLKINIIFTILILIFSTRYCPNSNGIGILYMILFFSKPSNNYNNNNVPIKTVFNNGIIIIIYSTI